MPKIIIDDRPIECRDKISVLQAALEAGWDIPHYCYHPGLSIVASCRLCLMQMKMPDPKTKELAWSPRLLPSCQTPVKDGMELRFASPEVRENQQRCMEFFLLNHPLDCPVCDQAGECYLQDYSERFGSPAGRMVEEKYKNPKKDIGSRTLLYSDRCVLCSRCLRFCNEIAGTNELCVVNRGSREEVDVFPGRPLENALQGNVVDLCPVGALLDKGFLMKRRVWELAGTPSICPRCSTGCAIRIDHADGRVYRLKPRYHPGVNDWWMCDDGRFGWKYIHDPKRLARLIVRRGGERETPDWSALPLIARVRFEQIVKRDGAAKVGALLSPFMSCEEAWLLAKFIRGVAPDATLAMGPVPVAGEDQNFPKGDARTPKFTIHAEKCPNRRGVETVLGAAAQPDQSRDPADQSRDRKGAVPAGARNPLSDRERAHALRPGQEAGQSPGDLQIGAEPLPYGRGSDQGGSDQGGSDQGGSDQGGSDQGGTVVTFDEFVNQAAAGAFSAAWIVGGYPADWVTKDLAKAAEKIELIFAQDLFPNAVTALAAVVLPACSWAERAGCFVNRRGLVQPFETALPPPEGCQRDGQYLYAVAGYTGLYNPAKVRELMAKQIPAFAALHVPPPEPENAH